MKKLSILIIMSVFLSSNLLFAESQTLYKVGRIFDGDTVQLVNEQKVDLIGIDAPQAVHDAKPYEEALVEKRDIYKIMGMGKKSKLFLQNLLQGTNILLETNTDNPTKDGRLQAYAYIPVCKGECEYQPIPGFEYVKKDDGIYIFVNATMLKSGFARVRSDDPYLKYTDLFSSLEKEAMVSGRGLWPKRKLS